ncbi:hypothetical protein CRI77_24000 [Mycolicibacterium duvalii]|uniref:Uncharacterized protein n=1 Tax=Mycolicibacterium duvalii TaxID=39688 RepID=A0A7I7JXU9_9MYCO|nr:hypothetical protein [Mycolicibacterium duvalii]MCV7366944.1 hypothetical protein [Mycolicibacterium duvalii]PEG35980.1 hypothetical protein CRI77_24000 [Mycolicibacterium duvalii]BBX16593.1 hypothetical protein MDUV_14530 [Mycolicibacterium duvalii]
MSWLVRPFVLFLRYWPQLAACYLLGLLGRNGAIWLAAWAGWDNDLWASLIMPLAGIARLGSYVAMFFVLRPAIPGIAALPHRSARSVDLFSSVILPFFAIYLAWQMFREDWLAFEVQALDYRMADSITNPGQPEIDPENLPVSTTTWVVIGIALVARFVLSRYSEKLPGWFVAVRIYVDALWVFLALTFSVNQGLSLLLNPAGWLAERRIVVWFSHTRESLFAYFAPLETVWDTGTWAVKTVFGGAAVPLIWLAVAGIVYGVSASQDWRALAQRVAGERARVVMSRHAQTRKRVQSRWQRLPTTWRSDARGYLDSRLGRFKPIVDSGRILLHGGIFALSLYVLAYLGLAWLDMAGSFYRPQLGSGYLLRGMAWLIGPQSQQFWYAALPTLELLVHLIVEPLRICLIAVTLGYCLHRIPSATAVTEARSSPPLS